MISSRSTGVANLSQVRASFLVEALLYALEINDPRFPDLVRRADAGEKIIDTTNFSENKDDDSNEQKSEALAEIICRTDDETAAALFVLMGTLETSAHPKLLANIAKHVAFTRCGESNLYGNLSVGSINTVPLSLFLVWRSSQYTSP